MRRKRGLATRLLAAVAVAVALVASLPAPAAAKYASLVMDAETGRVLHEVNADTRNYPASLTKMMTLYLVFEALEQGRLTLDQRMAISAKAARQPASKLALRAGRSISVEDAILALVTKSANDVAVVVSEWLGGTERNFALKMTAKARALGMSRTTFRNASGLPNRGQLSTARDMATLARALLRDFPQHYHFFSTRTFRYGGLRHKNHNRLLARYAGTDGIKTGYIRASGFNLVASARRGGHRLIGVVFGGRSPSQRDKHLASLMDKGFAALDPATVMAEAKPARVPVVRQTARTSGPPRGPWAIQVGAYRSPEPARVRAEAAAEVVPTLLEDGMIQVVHSQKGSRRPYYLARIVNIGRAEAYRACRTLKAKRIDCLEMRLAAPVAATGAAPPPKPATQPTVAKAEAEAKAEVVAVSSDAAEGPWGIQVGAYRQPAPALAIARTAASIADEFVADGTVAVVRHANRGRRPYFLARIHGLGEKEARLACRTLERRDIDCLQIKIGAGTRVAAVDTRAVAAPPAEAESRAPAPAVPAAWGVQVGAYPRYQPAYEMARRAVEIVPEKLKDGTIKVVPLSKGKRRPLYRARVVGISKAQAYGACRALEARDLDCMELRLRGVQVAQR